MSVGCSRRGQPAMRWGTWRGAASTGHWVGFRFPPRESSFPVPCLVVPGLGGWALVPTCSDGCGMGRCP